MWISKFCKQSTPRLPTGDDVRWICNKGGFESEFVMRVAPHHKKGWYVSEVFGCYFEKGDLEGGFESKWLNCPQCINLMN